jgi:hypothetical protein
VSLDEREELDQLRRRVRAARRATSAPMLVFGLVTLLFAGYRSAIPYSYIPGPLHWTVCSLLALIVLAGLDVLRRARTGVGPGRIPYRKAAGALLAAVVIGNVVWLLPFVQMLLWPGPVLTMLALWQRNNQLAVRAGLVTAVMVGGWFLRLLVDDAWPQLFCMAAGGVVLVLWGLVARSQERTIA